MLKKFFLAGTALAFIAGASVAVPMAPAMAKGKPMTCRSYVKSKHLKTFKARRAAMKACRAHARSMKKMAKKK